MSEVAKAYVSLIPSAKGIAGGIQSEIGGATAQASKSATAAMGKEFATGGQQAGASYAGGVKSQLKTVAATAGALIAAGAVKNFFSDSIAEARESQKINALTAQVIKSTGAAAGLSADQIGNLAGKLSVYAGIDDEVVQGGENLLLTFTNIRNEVGKGNDIFNQATKIGLDMSVALGQDMKASAIQLGKALNDPVKGVTALSRVGVSFTEQQKKQIKTLVESGNVLGAQKVILKELNKEFGGAAGAAATPMQKLRVAVGNLKEQVGTALLPVIDKAATFLQNVVVPVLGAVFGWIQKNSGVIKVFAIVLAPLVAAWATYAVVTKAAAIAQGIFNAVMAANPVVLVIAAIVAFVAVLVIAYNKVGWFRDFVQGAFKAITGAVSSTIDWIKANWPLLIAILTGPIGVVTLLIIRNWDKIKGAASAVKDWIVGKWNATVSFLTGIPGRVSAAVSGLFNRAKALATDAVNWVRSKFDSLIGFMRGLPGRVSSAVAGMFQGLWNSFKSAVNMIIRGWNNLEFHFGGVNTHIPGVGKIGGFTIGTPNIPYLAKGAIVKATPGGTVARVAEAGRDEAVVPLPNGFADKFARAASDQPTVIVQGPLVALTGEVHMDSERGILETSRRLAEESNRALRAQGISVALTGIGKNS